MKKFQIKLLRLRWRKRKAKEEKQKQSVRTSIKDLPSEISLAILNKLPVTSLFSLKLVCKASSLLVSSLWVSHPTLTLRYQALQKNPYWLILRTLPSSTNEPCTNNQLYLIDSWRVLRKFIHPKIEKKYKAGPILSCNGLLCLLYYKNKRGSSLDHYRAYLFNPLTGEHNFLLDPALPRVEGGESSRSGDMVWPKQFFGFGFDARALEYKLVRIVRFSPADVRTYLQVEVFTLGRNGCRIYKIDSISTPFVCPHESSDVVVGGAIHWLCRDENSARFDPRIILSFDLFEEKFHQIPKPNCEFCEFRKISVLGGCLAVTGGFCRSYEVHIWVLKEYGVMESWTKEFVIREGSGRLYPLFLLNDGQVVMSCGSKGLCCYDPKEDGFNSYAELDQSIVPICHACSLVSPFGL